MGRTRFEETKKGEGPVGAMIRRVATAARKKNAQLGLFDADAIVHTLLDELAAVLKDEGRLQLPGFGVFYVRTRKATVVRKVFGVPANIPLPARTWVTFRPAKSLRAALEDGK